MQSLKNKKNLIVSTFISFIIVGAAFSPASAADLTVSCNTSGCTTSPLSGPIFDETNVLPLDSFTREVEVVNASGGNLTIKPTIIDESGYLALNDVIRLTVKDKVTGDIKYGPLPLSNWGIGNSVTIDTIPNSQTRSYYFIATLDNVGNTFQNVSYDFDLRLIFDNYPDGGGGSVLGVSTSVDNGKVLGAAGNNLLINIVVGVMLVTVILSIWIRNKFKDT